MVLRLVTIPFSHYCDKARWALERSGLPFVEEGHPPLLHWASSLRAGGGRTVPVLVTPDGVLADSTDILRWVDARVAPSLRLYGDEPEIAALEDDFDRGLGPAARRFAYFHILQQGPACAAVFARDVPRWEGALAVPSFPMLRALMRRGMRIDAVGAARSLERVHATFDAIDRRLADGRAFLVGDRFTAADLTFASLAGPLVLPPGYAERVPPLDEAPPALRDEILALRARPAGQHVLRMYALRAAPRAG